MPSPIAHLATAAFIARFTQPETADRSRFWRWWIVCLAFSMAPDFDAVIGILRGELAAWHNQASHSLIAGLLVAAVVLPFAAWFLSTQRVMRLYGWLCLLYCIPLLMDAFTYGRGIKLFWPISDLRFRSPFLLFYGLRWSDGLVSSKHWITLISEGVYALLLFLIAYVVIGRHKASDVAE